MRSREERRAARRLRLFLLSFCEHHVINNQQLEFESPGIFLFRKRMIDSVSDEGAAAAADLKRGRRRKSPIAEAGKLDRLPPHAPEAEQGVLGCVLLSPNECMGECIGRFKEGAEVFYDLRHQTIYGALAEMYDKREAIDVITLQQRLKDKQLLEEVGGIAYLASLPDAVPSAANLGYYLDIVQEKHLLRRMIHTCTDVVGRV
jgi:replicative DNA helicase